MQVDARLLVWENLQRKFDCIMRLEMQVLKDFETSASFGLSVLRYIIYSLNISKAFYKHEI